MENFSLQKSKKENKSTVSNEDLKSKESKKDTNIFKESLKKLGYFNKNKAMYALAAFLSLTPVISTSCGSEKESANIECNLEDNTINRFQNYEDKRKTVVFSEEMVGRKVGELFKDYLNIESDTIPQTADVDYFTGILNLWHKKVNRENTSEATKDNAGKVLQTYYENKDLSNLKNFQKDISRSIKTVNENLDREKMGEHFKFNEKENQVLKDMSELISSENLLAYGMTELMPSIEDGKFNKEVLSFLLENAGKNYILSIPALHDKYLSFGLYQFTSFAVKSDTDGKDGASVINDFLKKEHQIPGSVSKLKEDDHHKAAYLFSIYNLARVLRQGDLNSFEKFLNQKSEKEKKEIISIYIATAHHLPAPSRTAFINWLKVQNSGVKGYIDILNKNNEALKQYAIKTSNNLSALDKSYQAFKLKDFPKDKPAKKASSKKVAKKK
ncbi:hypothetical protein SDC9_08011 [bioreactor metagenome]|uniref:Uncharacterized protein n=1 Tax=bioreactor metagenome TaxID=1076179 RepID=A0A644T922_9ZZZZ|nr:hypothetical protein [Candidatus Elulimicrobiales bacterium]